MIDVMYSEECERMERDEIRGLRKKSFELYWHGGSVWCEHLDALGNEKEIIREKLLEDARQFLRPSAAGRMIINLDETDIGQDLAELICGILTDSNKAFTRIAFVGVPKKKHSWFQLLSAFTVAAFFDDYEKAKEWILP